MENNKNTHSPLAGTYVRPTYSRDPTKPSHELLRVYLEQKQVSLQFTVFYVLKRNCGRVFRIKYKVPVSSSLKLKLLKLLTTTLKC